MPKFFRFQVYKLQLFCSCEEVKQYLTLNKQVIFYSLIKTHPGNDNVSSPLPSDNLKPSTHSINSEHHREATGVRFMTAWFTSFTIWLKISAIGSPNSPFQLKSARTADAKFIQLDQSPSPTFRRRGNKISMQCITAMPSGIVKYAHSIFTNQSSASTMPFPLPLV